MNNSIDKAARARVAAIDHMKESIIGESYNNFCELIYRLHDACYADIVYEPFAIGKFFKEEMYINRKKYFILGECEALIRRLSSESPDFDTLYEFANFIKYMEKVFFYKNDADSMISCDSQLDDTTKTLIFKTSKEVLIKVIINNTKRIIDINTYRYYGKNMIFGYTIVDRKVDFNGRSDIVLMNNIVLIMEKMMASFFLKMVIAIANGKIGIHPLDIKFEPKDWKDLNIYEFIDEYYYSIEYDYKLTPTPTYNFIQKLLKNHILYDRK